jgi:hypothetical protein
MKSTDVAKERLYQFSASVDLPPVVIQLSGM